MVYGIAASLSTFFLEEESCGLVVAAQVEVRAVVHPTCATGERARASTYLSANINATRRRRLRTPSKPPIIWELKQHNIRRKCGDRNRFCDSMVTRVLAR